MANETNTPLSSPPVPVTITSQYIKDFSFENPNAPYIYASAMAAPDIAMNVNINTRAVDTNAYEVVLSLKIEAKIQGKTAFVSELSYGGTFAMPQLPEETTRLFLLVEAPRLLFPFARTVLMGAIRDGGYPQVMINPIDFYSLYVANKDKIGAMSVGGAA